MKAGTVSSVLELLKAEDAEVRFDGAMALGEMEDAEAMTAVPGLLRLLKCKDFGVRLRAGLALRNLGPEAKIAVPVLIKLLKNRNAGVRLTAAHALGNIGPEALASRLDSLRVAYGQR